MTATPQERLKEIEEEIQRWKDADNHPEKRLGYNQLLAEKKGILLGMESPKIIKNAEVVETAQKLAFKQGRENELKEIIRLLKESKGTGFWSDTHPFLIELFERRLKNLLKGE